MFDIFVILYFGDKQWQTQGRNLEQLLHPFNINVPLFGAY